MHKKIFFILYLSVIFLIFSIVGNVYASDSNSQNLDEWRMFHRYLNHTGYYPAYFNINDFGKFWNRTTGSPIYSSPAVAGGIAYIGSSDKNVYAFNATNGNVVWKYTTDSPIDESSPAVKNDIVYIGNSLNGMHLYALNTTNGNMVWTYTATSGIYTAPAVGGDVVYFGEHFWIKAINATNGNSLWNYYITGADSYSSPAIVDDWAYIGSYYNNLYAINATNGNLKWSYATPRGIKSSPAVTEGRVFFGSDDNKIYALNSTTGAYIWSYTTAGPVYSSPAVAGGTVYVGSHDNNVYAINATNGNFIWRYGTGGWIDSSPAVAFNLTDTLVLVGSNDGQLYALDGKNGAKIWSYAIGAAITSSPAIANISGRIMIFVGSNNNQIYAFRNSIGPDMTIISPTNSTYSSAMVDYNISLDEAGDWCGYSLDGAVNVTMTKINDTYFSFTANTPNGQHYVIFYCNDTAGNMNSSIYLAPDISQLRATADVSVFNTIWASFLKFNISVLPPGIAMNNTILALFRSAGDASPIDVNAYNCSLAASGQTWVDTGASFVGAPIELMSMKCDFTGNITRVSPVNGWYNWNVTAAVANDYALGKANSTVRLNSTYGWDSNSFVTTGLRVGTTSNGQSFNPSETATNTPYMYFTYFKPRYFTVAHAPPQITIQSPTNSTYPAGTIDYNVTLNEPGSWCGYSLDGAPNITMTKITDTYFSYTAGTPNIQQHYVIFYCNDTSGDMNNTMVMAEKTLQVSDDISLGSGFNWASSLKIDISVLPLGIAMVNDTLSLWRMGGDSVTTNINAYNCSLGKYGQNWTENDVAGIFTSMVCDYTGNFTSVSPAQQWYYWNITKSVANDYALGMANSTIRLNQSIGWDSSPGGVLNGVQIYVGTVYSNAHTFNSSEAPGGNPYINVSYRAPRYFTVIQVPPPPPTGCPVDVSCSVKTSCDASENAILKMYSPSNSHAETAGGANYNYKVCCNAFGTSCTGNYAIPLKLSSDTNAHVEKNFYNDYTVNTCVSLNVKAACVYRTSQPCPTCYACLASISSDRNAHIGDCNYYPTKVCCGPLTNPISTIISPEAHSWQAGNFQVSVEDLSNLNLKTCEYRVESNGVETKPWATRNCNSDFTVTVGPTGDCRDQGIDACMIHVRATDEMNNIGNEDSRNFNIAWEMYIQVNDYPDPTFVYNPITFDASIINPGGKQFTAIICDSPDCSGVKYCYMSSVGGVWTCDYTPTAAGTFPYYLNVTDISGNSAVARGDFTVIGGTGILLAVKPKEMRLDIKSKDLNIAEVTLTNPTANDSFTIEMSGNQQGLPLPWINFVCTSSGCTIDSNSDDKVALTGMAKSSKTITIHLDAAGKAGTFPIRFIARLPDGTPVAETTGSLMIFSESFPEIFGLAVIILIVGAIAIYWYEINRKKTRQKY